jgi:hypothetical protein
MTYNLEVLEIGPPLFNAPVIARGLPSRLKAPIYTHYLP